MTKKLLSLTLAIMMLFSCFVSLSAFAAVSAGEEINYNYAPYAGVYAVVADANTTLTSEIGSVASLTAGETGYIYLVRGANVLTNTAGANLTITSLDGNGLSYLDQITMGELPITSGDGNAVATGLNKTLAPGESYEFLFSTDSYSCGNGIVYPYIYMSDANTVKISVTTDTGFYAELAKSGNVGTWCYADAAGTDFETLYVRPGLNTITITNIGDASTIISNINMNSTQAIVENSGLAHLASQVNLESLKPIDMDQLDPIPVPGVDRVELDSLPGSTKLEAESAAAATSTVDGTRIVTTAKTDTNLSYSFSATENTTMDLYLSGAAWKDVSFDVSVDGTPLSYETLHFNTPWDQTPVYNQEKVFSFPVTRGNHVISLYFYTDSFKFDYLALMPHYADAMKLLNGVNAATNANEIYEYFDSYGTSLGVIVAEDTANLHAPETAFWSMVGKSYEDLDALLEAYDAMLEREATTPSVTFSGTTATISTTYLPADASVVVGVYQNNQLIHVDSAVLSGTTYTADVTGYNSSKVMKVFILENLDEVKPETTDGVYRHIYVATNGKSTNAGTQAAPLNTLANALKAVKKINANMTGDIIIHVAPGVYRSNSTITIDPTMSGKNGYNVIIRAEDPNDMPVFSGGEPLTGKWSKVSGQNYWVATTTTRETRTLYVNGYQATLAKTDVSFKGNAYITPETPINDLHQEDGIRVSLSSYPNFPKTVEGISNMMLVTNLAWANQRLPVDKITYDSNYAYIYIKQPRYHILLDSMTSTICPTYDKPYYLENAMAFLDQPGEFYFDKSARKMYYYPYSNEDMETAETYCSVTDGLLNLAGVSDTNKVSNIVFEGISFRYGAHDKVTADGAAFNQTDDQWLGGEIGFGRYLFPGQITLNHTDSISFKDCEFTCLGSNAVNIENSSDNIKISGCYFHDISGTGVVVGSQLNPVANGISSTDRVHNVEVDNNIFRRCAQEFLGCTAISLYYAGEVYIHHNDIKDMPYSAIVAGWGWGEENPEDVKNNRISYNRIENALQVLDDGAQIYTVGRMDNLQINDNYFINPGTHRRAGLYFDAVTTNTYAADNVFEKANDSGDIWFFARTGVQINDCYFGYNYSDGKQPYRSYWDYLVVETVGNHMNLKSWPQEAQRIIAESGVEDKTRITELPAYPSWRKMRMKDTVIVIN